MAKTETKIPFLTERDKELFNYLRSAGQSGASKADQLSWAKRQFSFTHCGEATEARLNKLLSSSRRWLIQHDLIVEIKPDVWVASQSISNAAKPTLADAEASRIKKQPEGIKAWVALIVAILNDITTGLKLREIIHLAQTSGARYGLEASRLPPTVVASQVMAAIAVLDKNQRLISYQGAFSLSDGTEAGQTESTAGNGRADLIRSKPINKKNVSRRRQVDDVAVQKLDTKKELVFDYLVCVGETDLNKAADWGYKHPVMNQPKVSLEKMRRLMSSYLNNLVSDKRLNRTSQRETNKSVWYVSGETVTGVASVTDPLERSIWQIIKLHPLQFDEIGIANFLFERADNPKSPVHGYQASSESCDDAVYQAIDELAQSDKIVLDSKLGTYDIVQK